MNNIPIENFEAKHNLNDISEKLSTFGIVKIKNYFSENEVKNLMSSADYFINNNDDGIKIKMNHENNEKGINLELDPKVETENMKIINKIFDKDLLKKVMINCFKPYEFSFNKDLMLVKLFESKNQILPWHFDRVQSYKFWINLGDVDEKNGAMEYAPSTHWEGKYRANSHMLSGNPLSTLPNDIYEKRIISKTILKGGPKDLFIFDSDGFHRGGIISSGERLIIRSHCYPNPSRNWHDPKISLGSLIKSNLNLSKIFSTYSTRKIGNYLNYFNAKKRDKIIRKYFIKKN